MCKLFGLLMFGVAFTIALVEALSRVIEEDRERRREQRESFTGMDAFGIWKDRPETDDELGRTAWSPDGSEMRKCAFFENSAATSWDSN